MLPVCAESNQERTPRRNGEEPEGEHGGEAKDALSPKARIWLKKWALYDYHEPFSEIARYKRRGTRSGMVTLDDITVSCSTDSDLTYIGIQPFTPIGRRAVKALASLGSGPGFFRYPITRDSRLEWLKWASRTKEFRFYTSGLTTRSQDWSAHRLSCWSDTNVHIFTRDFATRVDENPRGTMFWNYFEENGTVGWVASSLDKGPYPLDIYTRMKIFVRAKIDEGETDPKRVLKLLRESGDFKMKKFYEQFLTVKHCFNQYTWNRERYLLEQENENREQSKRTEGGHYFHKTLECKEKRSCLHMRILNILRQLGLMNIGGLKVPPIACEHYTLRELLPCMNVRELLHEMGVAEHAQDIDRFLAVLQVLLLKFTDGEQVVFTIPTEAEYAQARDCDPEAHQSDSKLFDPRSMYIDNGDRKLMTEHLKSWYSVAKEVLEASAASSTRVTFTDIEVEYLRRHERLSDHHLSRYKTHQYHGLPHWLVSMWAPRRQRYSRDKVVPSATTSKIMKTQFGSEHEHHTLIQIWRRVATFLPQETRDALRFECKILARAVADWVPFWVKVAPPGPRFGAKYMTVHDALDAFVRFRQKHPWQRFEIRVGEHGAQCACGSDDVLGNGSYKSFRSLRVDEGFAFRSWKGWVDKTISLSGLRIATPEVLAEYESHRLSKITLGNTREWVEHMLEHTHETWPRGVLLHTWQYGPPEIFPKYPKRPHPSLRFLCCRNRSCAKHEMSGPLQRVPPHARIGWNEARLTPKMVSTAIYRALRNRRPEVLRGIRGALIKGPGSRILLDEAFEELRSHFGQLEVPVSVLKDGKESRPPAERTTMPLHHFLDRVDEVDEHTLRRHGIGRREMRHRSEDPLDYGDQYRYRGDVGRRNPYSDTPSKDELEQGGLRPDHDHLYLQQLEMEQYLPGLIERANLAPFGPNRLCEDISTHACRLPTLFISPESGVMTSLHFDMSEGSHKKKANLYAQLTGKKLWVLFPPSGYNLDMTLDNRDAPHVSGLTTFVLKVLAMPLREQKAAISKHRWGHALAEVWDDRIEVTLNAGDAILLPPGWWHCTASLSPGVGVNWWFDYH